MSPHFRKITVSGQRLITEAKAGVFIQSGYTVFYEGKKTAPVEPSKPRPILSRGLKEYNEFKCW